MDFAKKQMEKFGWKEGNGLGKNNQGMVQAIKPTLKTGKEGMGYDFSKELVDTWWTRAYDDSLKRINIATDGDTSEIVGVTLNEDDDDNKASKEDIEKASRKKGIVASVSGMVERPFEKMKKRMMKARFTTFSKGATLSNGEMVIEAKSDSTSDDSDDDDSKKEDLSKGPKSLTDEELFKACGGRTAHKAARFGLKLNGKLARIAAQEEASKCLISKPQKIGSDEQQDDLPSRGDLITASKVKKEKRKKKKSKREAEENPEEVDRSLELEPIGVPEPAENMEDSDFKKKRRKNKKRKYAELENDQSGNPAPISCPDIDNSTTVDNKILEDDPEISSSKSLKKKKKSKKVKLAGNSDDEMCALLSE